MGIPPQTELTAEDRREVAKWIAANRAQLPEAVQRFLGLHEPYLTADGNLKKALDESVRNLRRALHLIPSSEKRRPSGSPLAGLPRTGAVQPKSAKEKVEAQIDRCHDLADWHEGLTTRHTARAKKLEEKLAKMPKEQTNNGGSEQPEEIPRLEDIELTEEQIAQAKAAGARFAEHLQAGDGPDPALRSVNETLMPAGSVLERIESAYVPAVVPEALADAEVVETLYEERVRYDFAVEVTRVELDVEKKVLVDQAGERHVVAGSTREYGPPRYAVTWSALATLMILVGQFALPYNRLATMLSTPGKRFTAGAFSRMMNYVARRFVPLYLELARQLADAEVLAGDDTSCRVIEVSSYFAKSKDKKTTPGEAPWAPYRTPRAAEASFRRAQVLTRARQQRREDGDRNAKPTPEETPSLGVLIGRKLPFESPLKNGNGNKEAMHTTVVSGRSVADDPSSLVIFYRSHLGGCGNLFEALLADRDPKLRQLVLQGDMSTTNPVSSDELLKRFDIRFIGCTAHARRPFANYEDEDPMRCEHMLHLFLGLAIHEQQLDVFGRNRDNVLAVRGSDSRKLWGYILELANTMAEKWSPATKLGTAARYIIKHFDALTAYLDDPRLEPTNNLRERMLRTEKLIEGSALFRRSLEGRFVLDVVRTLLQTAVAAGVPVREYLVSVLQTSDDDLAKHPERFTPHAWAAANASTDAPDE